MLNRISASDKNVLESPLGWSQKHDIPQYLQILRHFLKNVSSHGQNMLLLKNHARVWIMLK